LQCKPQSRASELIGHRGVTQARQAVILTDRYKIGTLQILFRRSLKGKNIDGLFLSRPIARPR
jgi:hypothetical protein